MLEGQTTFYTIFYFPKDAQTFDTHRDRPPPSHCVNRNNSVEINITCDEFNQNHCEKLKSIGAEADLMIMYHESSFFEPVFSLSQTWFTPP